MFAPTREPLARRPREVDDREGFDLREAGDLFLQLAVHRIVAGHPVEGLDRIRAHLRDVILQIAQDQIHRMDRTRRLLAEDRGQVGDVAPRVLQGVGAQLQNRESHSDDRDHEQYRPCHHGRHVPEQSIDMTEHESTISRSHCATIKVAASVFLPGPLRCTNGLRPQRNFNGSSAPKRGPRGAPDAARITSAYFRSGGAQPGGAAHSPLSSCLPPSCLSLANTASTLSSSAGFLAACSASLGFRRGGGHCRRQQRRAAILDRPAFPWRRAALRNRDRSGCTGRASPDPSAAGSRRSSGCARGSPWMVDLVVPTRRMICASLSSGWLRTSQRIAFGRSWRRDTGV